MFLARRIVWTLALGLGVSLVSASAAAQMKVAVVDTQRAVMETEDGLRMQATLKKVFDSRQRELDKKQEELQKEREDIEKQRDVLSKTALAKRVDKWQREMVNLQTVFVEYNKELQKRQSELTQPIFQKAMGVIRRMATQEGYDVVVDKQAVPYVRSDLDLTDKVIQLYNQGAPADAGDKTGKDKTPAPKSTGPTPLTPPAVLPPPAVPAAPK
ncbi:MAG TPA: OmpH family outer membrane protein [Polyangiaceae bacterium]|nr:OmpH family outer membrane protein [Polyangiaceae bacterium]